MAAREEFFKYLGNWLICWFCEEQCSEKVGLHYLQCGGISCARCINKMYEPKLERKINCGHCKKIVGFIRIHPDMPERFRVRFENPEKYLEKYLEVENSQSYIRQSFIDYMDTKIENVIQEGNKLRKEGMAVKKSADEIATKRDQLIARVSSVIPVERIDELVETMPLEVIKEMPYEQMVAGQKRLRRRSSVYHPSPRSHSNSTSSLSQYRSSHNLSRLVSSDSPLRQDFNNLRLENQFRQQPVYVDQRLRFRDSKTLRSTHQQQRQPTAAGDTRRRSCENLGAVAVAIGCSRRRSSQHARFHSGGGAAAAEPIRRQSGEKRNARNVPNVSDPNARMAFHR